MKIRKITRRRPCFLKYPKLGHSKLLFTEDGKEMYKDLQCTDKTVAFLIKPFYGVLVVIAVVFCLRSLLTLVTGGHQGSVVATRE